MEPGGYAEAGADMTGADDGREPCRFCGGKIRVGARKCPLCREYLDAALAEDRRQQIEQQVEYIVASEELIAQVKNYVILAGVGSCLLCFLGPLFGPAVLGYGLYYQNRARQLQMPDLPKIRLLFAFSGLWIATGVICWGLIIYLVNFR